MDTFSRTLRSPILFLSSGPNPSKYVPRDEMAQCLFVCRDRMLNSAMNFAIGFFGYPFEGQYQQSITIEETGVSSRCHRSFVV